MNIIDKIQNRLVLNNQDSLIDRYKTHLQTINQWIKLNKNYPKILISESDPILFLSAFMTAITAKCPIFLCNPQWGQQEWTQVYHVSGLMQWMRSLLTDGQLIITSFKTVEAEEWINFNPTDYFISLVPTQLHRLLQSPSLTHWLSQFQIVLLGGAPPWLELLEQSRLHQIPLALTYGMTETASQIVTLKPSDFLRGNNSCGQVLPHAEIKIYDKNGKELKTNQTGIIKIKADSLMLGYYQDNFNPNLRINTFTPDDLGYWDEQGYLTLVGRQTNKIITGGENVFPTEVEAVIRATGLVKDICVIGKTDQYWGEIVVAVYVPDSKEVSQAQLEQAILGKLSKFKHPKLWISVEQLPRNSQGKINQQQIQKWVMDYQDQ